MEAHSDLALLQKWRQHQDAHAFRTLTQRYGGLVFGVCNRVLKNASDAEEITQDCFLKLARNPEKVNRAVGPWLHSVAVNAAIGRIRSEQRRRAREAVYQEDQPSAVEYTTRDLLDHVDEAIHQLPEVHRHCVVAWFLEGKPRQELADELGVSTKTIQRKTDEAIEKIRELLGQRGIAMNAAALGAVLTGLKADAMPSGLSMALGKIAVAGNTEFGMRAAAERAIQTGGIVVMKKNIAVAAGIGILGLLCWWLTMERNSAYVGVTPGAPMVTSTPKLSAMTEIKSSGEPPIPEEVKNADTMPAFPASTMIDSDAIPPIANPTRYASISGTVLDNVGLPVPNTSVTLVVTGVSRDAVRNVRAPGLPDVHPENPSDALARWRSKAVLNALYTSPSHRYETMSDETGRYHIPGIRFTGAAQIAAQADGFELEQRSLELTEATEAEANFNLKPGRIIHGRVVTREGAPVADARVSWVSRSKSAVRIRGTVTPPAMPKTAGRPDRPKLLQGGSVGTASMSSIAPVFQTRTDRAGLFSLTLADADAAGLIVETENLGLQVFHDVPVGGDELITLTLEGALGALDGQVLLADTRPATGYLVFAAGTIGDPESDNARRAPTPVEGSRFAVETDADGHFKLEGMPVPQDYTITVYDRAGQKRGVGSPPTLTGDDRTSWRFQLPPALRVSGRVIGKPSGQPMPGAYVTAKPGALEAINLMDAARVQTGPDGAFMLELIGDERSFDLVASVHRALDSLWSAEHVRRVELTDGDSAETTLEIPDPWRRQFLLVDPGGAPVAGASIRALQENDVRGGYIDDLRDAQTDQAGGYTTEAVGAGVYTQFTFRKEGYIDSRSARITGTPGETLPEEIVVIYPAASARARLLDAGGAPLEFADVLCTARYGDNQVVARKLATDAVGVLAMDAWIPAGTVTLELRLPDLAESAHTVFGSNGPDPLTETAVLEAEEAEAAQTEHVILDYVEFSEGTINDLGDLVLGTETDADQ